MASGIDRLPCESHSPQSQLIQVPMERPSRENRSAASEASPQPAALTRAASHTNSMKTGMSGESACKRRSETSHTPLSVRSDV